MNVIKMTTKFALILLFALVGICVSCVEEEQAPFSEGAETGFYVQMPGYGEFYIGSEVVLKGSHLSEISKVYVEGISPDFDLDKLENGEYAGLPDLNADGIPDEFQRIKARIAECTDNELVFILPAGTNMGSATLYYERGEELIVLNVLDNIREFAVDYYEEEDGFVIMIMGDTPLPDDKVYLQYVKRYSEWGEAVLTGEWIEAPIISMDENILKVKPMGVGETYVLYVHNGETISCSYSIYLEPMYSIQFPENTDYYAGDEVTITGGFFVEGDVITIDSVPVEIISIDTARDALTFRIPENMYGHRQIWLYRYGIDYYVSEIEVKEKQVRIQ